jgi:DNA-binding transcriptional LysR family regulator
MHAPVLRYLDEVVRQGSIRRAASQLNIAASAVNRQILKLEAEIGTKLFERVGRRLVLTPAGERIAMHVRKTMSEWNGALSEIREISGETTAEVAIIALPAFLERLVPDAIEEITAHYPKMRFNIFSTSPVDTVREMRSERHDLALLFANHHFRRYRLSDRIDCNLGVVVSPDHPLATAKAITLVDCAHYPLILLNDPWELDATLEMEFVRNNAPFGSRIVTNSFNLMKTILMRNLGIGFFSPIGFVEELRRGELVYVPFSRADTFGSVGLFVHVEREREPHIQLFIAALNQRFIAMRQNMDLLAPRLTAGLSAQILEDDPG